MKKLAVLALVVALGGPGPDREAGWDLKDPGFEAGSLARLPVLGWYSDDVQFGRVSSAGDEEVVLAGERSLRVTLVEPRRAGHGRASVTQTLRAERDDPARELVFSIGLRSCGLSEVVAHFYVWDAKNNAQLFREEPIVLRSDWERHAVPISVPEGHREFGVFLYLPNEKGGVLWLDEASLTAN